MEPQAYHFLDVLRSLSRDIDPRLLHALHRQRVDRFRGLGPGAVHVIVIAGEIPQNRFRHLTAA